MEKLPAFPLWPSNDFIFDNIVRKHNASLDDSAKAGAEKLDSSKSITLVMVCAGLQRSIPHRYILKTRGVGIRDHMDYVKDYLSAVKNGTLPSGRGMRVSKQVERFAEGLGISVAAINDALLRHPLLN